LADSLSNIITVITLRLEKRMESSLGEKIKAVFKPFRKNVVINEWKWFVADTLVALIYVVVAVGYVFQQREPGTIFYVGGLVTLLGYVNQFTSVFHDVAWQYTQVVQYNTDVLAVQGIKESFSNQHRPENAGILPKDWKVILVSGLNYSHNDSDSENNAEKIQGLRQVSIKLERGKRIAVIGESGSGKSTLLALMRGLYPAESVSIDVNGQKENSLAVISNTVTLFPQEPEIFENTIRYNITLGLPFSDAEIESVCSTAGFTEVVNMLPNGLESHIQEKGVNLSGGQKQRLALARGILAAQSSNIVLMDEPTSSVDPKTELLIYKRLFSAFADKVMVSSLHRLHLLPYFDYIYVMHQGRIVEEGNFTQLYENGILFRELWKHQEDSKVAQ
jgi:ATP-binding cassette, subfamily B, bacterial